MPPSDFRMPGFEFISAPSRPIMTVATHGAPRTGKTRWAATAPGRIGWLPLDRNSLWTAAKAAKELHKEIVVPSAAGDLIRISGDEMIKISKMSVQDAMKYYRRYVDRIKELYLRMVSDKRIDSIVVDTFSAVHSYTMMALYGRTMRILPRDRGPLNEEMREWISMSEKSTVWVHTSKDVWAGSGDSAAPTGELEPQGWNGIDYSVNCCIQHGKMTKKNEIRKALDLDSDDEVPPVLFWTKAYSVQANPFLVKGPESTSYGDDCNFASLGKLVYPESSKKDWL